MNVEDSRCAAMYEHDQVKTGVLIDFPLNYSSINLSNDEAGPSSSSLLSFPSTSQTSASSSLRAQTSTIEATSSSNPMSNPSFSSINDPLLGCSRGCSRGCESSCCCNLLNPSPLTPSVGVLVEIGGDEQYDSKVSTSSIEIPKAPKEIPSKSSIKSTCGSARTRRYSLDDSFSIIGNPVGNGMINLKRKEDEENVSASVSSSFSSSLMDWERLKTEAFAIVGGIKNSIYSTPLKNSLHSLNSPAQLRNFSPLNLDSPLKSIPDIDAIFGHSDNLFQSSFTSSSLSSSSTKKTSFTSLTKINPKFSNTTAKKKSYLNEELLRKKELDLILPKVQLNFESSSSNDVVDPKDPRQNQQKENIKPSKPTNNASNLQKSKSNLKSKPPLMPSSNSKVNPPRPATPTNLSAAKALSTLKKPPVKRFASNNLTASEPSKTTLQRKLVTTPSSSVKNSTLSSNKSTPGSLKSNLSTSNKSTPGSLKSNLSTANKSTPGFKAPSVGLKSKTSSYATTPSKINTGLTKVGVAAKTPVSKTPLKATKEMTMTMTPSTNKRLSGMPPPNPSRPAPMPGRRSISNLTPSKISGIKSQNLSVFNRGSRINASIGKASAITTTRPMSGLSTPMTSRLSMSRDSLISPMVSSTPSTRNNLSSVDNKSKVRRVSALPSPIIKSNLLRRS